VRCAGPAPMPSSSSERKSPVFSAAWSLAASAASAL
jgi:hypothetical protein